MTNKKLIILGAGGHARVILDIAIQCHYEVIGFLDDHTEIQSISGYPVLGAIDTCMTFRHDPDMAFIIGIGSNQTRADLSARYPLSWASLVHPRAVIGMNAKIGEGTVVMANATINPDASIGSHVIINTSCVVEHDCQIGDCAHISPGAVLAGGVTIGARTHVGAGAVVRNQIAITSGCLIGAGAVVVRNILIPGTYAGVPAHLL